MSNLLKDLNPSQREAVTHKEGPLLIIAGPGSGKTRTVVHSIAYAIEEWVQPDQILAFSFTGKACEDLKRQVKKNVDEEKANLVQISTFHSFCRKVLKEDIGRLHRTDALNFQDLDEDEQEKEDQRRVAQAINDLQYESVKLKDVHNFIIKCKLGVRPSNAGNSKYTKIYNRYEQRLKEDGWIDYPNQLLFTDELFRDVPKVKKKWQEKFALIFVDEYQDTDPVQYRIIKALAEEHQNLRVVGDDDQGIYGWRGADIQNILNFKNDYRTDKKLIMLEENYRSTQMIVKASRALVEFNPVRREKDLFTRNSKGEKVIHLRCENDEQEANTITSFIHRAIKQGNWQPSDFAVLYRTHGQAKAFKKAFGNLEIPPHVKGVSLMTIHSAKGLEFPNVFVAGVCSGLLPHFNSKKENWDEELRLLYVAMTRAKNWLCLSSYKKDAKFPRGRSRFLSYIPSSFLEIVETLDNIFIPPHPEEIPKKPTNYVEPLPEKLLGAGMTVIGVDPGNVGARETNVGWSVTQKTADGYSVLCFDTENPIGMRKDKLQQIKQKIDELIEEHSPDAIAVERIEVGRETTIEDWFRYVAECVTTIRSIADQHGIKCHLYTPQHVKDVVTGNRNACKEDVQKGVKLVCNLSEIPEPHHSADAIAASLCYLRSYLNSSRFEGNKRKKKRYEAGCDYLRKRQYEAAVAEFKEAINIDPIYADAHCGLGRAYLVVQGDLEKAENAAKKALRFTKNNHPDSQKLLDAIKHYRSGCSAVGNKQFNEAITKFQESIALEPFFIDARYELGRAHLRLSNNVEKAKNAVEEALKLTNDHSPIHLLSEAIRLYNEGRDSLNARQYNDAIDKLKEAIDRESNFTESHYWLGYAHFHNEALEAAEQSANDTLELNANHQLARALLDDIKKAYVDKGDNALERLDLTEAEEYTNKAFHIDEDCQLAHKLFGKIKRTYYNQACDCLSNKQYDHAILKFNKLINKDSNFIDAYCGLAKAYLGQGSLKGAGNYTEDLRDAENHTKKALKLDKNYKPVLQIRESIKEKYCELARDYLNRDGLTAAENYASEALILDENYKPALELLDAIKQAYYNRGCNHLDNQRYDGAITEFKAVLSRDTRFIEAYCGLGRTYLIQDNLRKAETHANKALKLDKNYKPALELLNAVHKRYFTRGLTSIERGSHASAIELLQKASNLNLNDKHVYTSLGRAYYWIDEYDKAASCYQKAANIDPNDKTIHVNLGNACYRMGNYDEAIKHLQKAKNLDPDCEKTNYYLGRTWLKLGKLQKARWAAEKALSIASVYQSTLKVLLEEIEQAFAVREDIKKLMSTDTMVLIPSDQLYMDKYPVTNDQYSKFIASNPQWGKNHIDRKYHDGNYLKHWNGNNYPSGESKHPVVYVSAYAVQAYAQWVKKRLPTETEWEKAARGNLINKKYPWGDSIDPSKANYGCNVGSSTPIGSYPSNDYGLYDMAGNVWEWCFDESNESSAYVWRGGSWGTLAQKVRVSSCHNSIPTRTMGSVGFRCVKTVTD